MLFGGPLDPVRSDLDPGDNSSTSDDDASVVATKRKYRKASASPAPEDSYSESQVADSLSPKSQQLRRPRQTPDTRKATAVLLSGAASPPDFTTPNIRRITSPAYRIPATRGRALGSRTKPRSRARRMAQTIAEKYAGTLSMWSGSCGGSGDQRPKRKRWGSSNNTFGWDSDHLNQRPAKQQRQRHVTNGPAEMLWTRLQQLEPRRTR